MFTYLYILSYGKQHIMEKMSFIYFLMFFPYITTIQYNTVHQCTIQYSAPPVYSTVYCTIQYNTMHHHVQYNVPLVYSTVYTVQYYSYKVQQYNPV